MLHGTGEARTILTTEPRAGYRTIHDRPIVVLDRAEWPAWLDLTRPEAESPRRLPAGSLIVEQIR